MTNMDDPTQMTAKEVILDVQRDVKCMRVDIAVLRSQDLNKRVSLLEAFRWQAIGTGAAGSIIAGLLVIQTLFLT